MRINNTVDLSAGENMTLLRQILEKQKLNVLKEINWVCAKFKGGLF
jgi:hypothetical protein